MGADAGRLLVLGAGMGTLAFIITQDALWVALGACLGIVVASILGLARQRRSDR
jgi:hypothetical protein